jgi:hypothetical protein
MVTPKGALLSLVALPYRHVGPPRPKPLLVSRPFRHDML